jgi:Na+/H+ antiporter NhaC
MSYLVGFLPILLFISLFVGSGIYFSISGADNAFYQLSPISAIIPAITLGWFMHKGKVEQRMTAFLDGVRHKDIITMCIIFLLAGAFTEVTKAIGSVDATVNLALSLIPSQFLLTGLFITSAFISTAIGTSMGTIATIAPIAAALSVQGTFASSIGVATVIGGAMLGDNLSVVSDTTIASVMSQEANIKEKFKLNSKIALISSILTIAILLLNCNNIVNVEAQDYSLVLVLPYVLLIILAASGLNVFVSLITSIAFAGLIGIIKNDYEMLRLSQDITKGFSSMQEIMLLSLMVGGLSGLSGEASTKLAKHLGEWTSNRKNIKLAQFMIAKIVAIFDILLANNVIAVIFSGEFARDLSKRYNLPAHYSATWLATFSCVFQGIIPYGAQILLASTIAGVSPLSVTPHVYYCYILGIVSILFISYTKVKNE